MSEVIEIDHDLGLSDEEVGKRIQDALDRDGCHGMEDIDALLRAGRLRMHRNPHGVWITEVCNYPLIRTLHVWIVAGQLPGVMDLQEEVIAHARRHHCQHITSTARLGWSREIGPKYGWKVHAVQMVLDI